MKMTDHNRWGRIAVAGVAPVPCRRAVRSLAIAALALGSSLCGSARDLTFIVTSDLHYHDGTNANYRIPADIDRINALPGKAYPASVGGVVGPISGVILNGDLTNGGSPKEWELFSNDWGLAGEKRCKFPIYEGVGNHDSRGGEFMFSNVVARNKSRPGLMNVSTNGLQYSWEWDGVHFIQCNVMVADDTTWAGRGSLDFVRKDLEKNVGNSGKPVIINFHISMLCARDWSSERIKAFVDALAPYNVVGVFYGHYHGWISKNGQRVPDPDYEHRRWPGTTLDMYDAGSLKDDGARPKWKPSGRFFVVHITDTNMTVIMNTPKEWGPPDGWGTPHVKALTK